LPDDGLRTLTSARSDPVNFSQVFLWLYETTFAAAIREGDSLFPWIESVHVLALTLVVGSISIVDLRLLGVVSVNRSIASVSADVLPFTWSAFACAVLSGSALFASHAVGYAQNLQFRMKLLLLALAGVNMLTFHLIMGRGMGRWSEPGVSPWPGKIAGSISLVLWIGIVAFGRWVGFEAVR
jgi:hypothetical protein